MDQSIIQQLGDTLYSALTNQQTIAPLTDSHPDITIEDAYQISLRLLQNRLDSGEKVIGKKIGVTSKAVMDMLDVRQPDFGFMTDAMRYDGEMPISKTLIQPRAEGCRPTHVHPCSTPSCWLGGLYLVRQEGSRTSPGIPISRSSGRRGSHSERRPLYGDFCNYLLGYRWAQPRILYRTAVTFVVALFDPHYLVHRWLRGHHGRNRSGSTGGDDPNGNDPRFLGCHHSGLCLGNEASAGRTPPIRCVNRAQLTTSTFHEYSSSLRSSRRIHR